MLKFLQKALSRALFFLPESVVRTVGFETFSYFGRAFSKPLAVSAGASYVNLGCGPGLVRGLINIDFFAVKGIDYAADLRYPLKIADASVDGIFSEHTLEHLAYPHADRLLGECHRIMKSGSRIRIVVPDVSLFISNYSEKNDAWFAKWEELYFRESPDEERRQRRLGSPLEALSFVTQEYGHQSCWDFQTLSNHLRKNGFVDVVRCTFMQGADPKLLVDQNEEDRKYVSLYVEAAKA
jgi:SAM-dependent methyltransferase